MKALAILAICLALVGCDTMTKRDAPAVTKLKYIINVIPEEMLAVPPQVPNIDLQVATDKDVSEWMLDGEKRTNELETKLKNIKALQDKRLLELKNLHKDDLVVNE